ncbi:MAG: multidrug resistance protein [Rhodothermaceae bacterium]|nr:MAG: multidrug resistance protein [Rhodothermaceae bacterium]
MKITDTAIKYRTAIMVLTVILTLGGLYSYLTIPKEAQPSIEVPNIVVTTVYPGASPSDIESLVTQKIEQEVQNISGIKEIRSTSNEGVSTVIVEFDPDVSMDDAFQKVRDKVDIAKAELPGDAEEPIVSEINFDEFPILTINLGASYSLARLKEVAEDLQDELESIPSVLEVDLIGGLEREVQVNVDLKALQAYNLTFNDLIQTIRDENTNLPGGSVDVDRLNYLVRVDGEFSDPSEIENLVLKAPGGTPVYVRDVADVIFGFKDRATYARLRELQREDEEGHLVRLPEERTGTVQVISLNVKKRSGENILETVEAVQQKLATFPFPSGTQIVITGDQSEFVRDLIKDLENNIISGLIFVIAVLLFFLGVRNATLVGIAIPLSMFISFIVLQALGYTLNFVILFSLIIALGMLVDNAIVIVENIYRYREEGHPRFEAARLATAEVGGAVVASTATTVAVFVPMLFWPGIIGEFMSYMPLTLIVTLSCSLFVAIVINPVITGIFVKLEDEERAPLPRTTKLVAAVVMVLLAMVLGFANWRTLLVLSVAIPVLYLLHTRAFKPIGDRFVRSGLPALVARYRRFLDWMLQRDYTPRRALLRNTFALGSLTLGVALLVLGGLIASAAGPMAGLILLAPGGLLLVLGLLGIFIHTLENIYLGGRTSVKAGLIFGAVVLVILSLMYLSPREVALSTIAELLILPLVIVAVGLLGMLFNRQGRRYLILTDNRARLLNGTLGGLFAIVIMYALAPTGVEFFPTTDPRQVMITAEGPLGMNIEASNRVALTLEDRINRLLDENPEVKANIKNLLVNVGVGGDAMFGGGAASPERSRLTLNIVDYKDRAESSQNTLAKLRAQLQGIPGVTIEFDQDQAGPPTGAPVNIEISGDDFDQIVRITKEIRQMLVEAAETGRIPGLVDVTDNLNTGRPEMKVVIDRERAARFGLSTAMIASTVRAAINGIEASTYRTGEDEYDITVRLREADRASLESLRNLTILHEGQQIPLVSVADLEISGGLGSITRLDLERVATVSGNAAPGYNGQAILQQVQTYLADYERSLPPGYHLAYTGENEEQQESFGFLTVVLMIGGALIFLIMVAQFNHVSSPFIIMVATGLSLIGVILGLILTRTPFGLMTFIGVISLAGIVVNNSIVLVDYTMQLRDRGLSKHDAIIEAGATRLRPVLLTALTTIIGLVPLTFGINVDFVGLLTDLDPDFQFGSENTQFWGPMGTAIISGLTFATFLTLVIVPVMYSAFDSVALRLQALFGRPGGEDDDDRPHPSATPALEPALPTGNGHGGAPVAPTATR